MVNILQEIAVDGVAALTSDVPHQHDVRQNHETEQNDVDTRSDYDHDAVYFVTNTQNLQHRIEGIRCIHLT